MIKLLTPSEDHTDEYREWLASFPNYIFPIVFIIKRFIPHEAHGHWRDVFSVDSVNGFPGHELKAYGRQLVGSYLRVGLGASGWRTFKVRQDFIAADKVQIGDDISASVVVPAGRVGKLPPGVTAEAFKFTVNCEARLFQRPDDAIHRGLDRQTEADLARPDKFLSNSNPSRPCKAREIVEKVTDFKSFTPPMQDLLQQSAAACTGYVVCSANPRIVDGQPSKNPRYLQIRPDLLASSAACIAEAVDEAGAAASPARNRSTSRSARFSWDVAAIRRTRKPAFAPWPCTVPFIIKNSPNCSWTSSVH